MHLDKSYDVDRKLSVRWETKANARSWSGLTGRRTKLRPALGLVPFSSAISNGIGSTSKHVDHP